MMKIRKEFKDAHPNIARLLVSKKYSFLDENEHLGQNIVLLGLGGSYSYGLDVHTPEHESDIDIRGVAVNSRKEILGLSTFEQFENKETDTVIYGMKKFINLLSANNPNIVEMLGLRDEDYIFISPVGKLLLDNKELFLSQRAANSFGGYANAQLRRIQVASARGTLPKKKKEEHKAKSMDNALKNLITAHDLEKYGEMTFRVDDKTNQIVIDTSLNGLPVDEFIDMMNVTKQVRDDYEDTSGNRNHKKDDVHINKHASHLIRLYKMGIELLKDKAINTYRHEDRQLLLDIKNGLWMEKNGLMNPDFYELVDSLEKELEYWKENTTLPKSPDYSKIEQLLMNINSMSI